MMGNFHEEKTLGDDQCLNSLEEKILVFFGEDSDEAFDHSFEEDCDDDDSGSSASLDRTEFWELQEIKLQEILAHNSFTGSKLQREVSGVLETARERASCHCPKPSSDGCATCLRRAVVNLLSDNSFNASLCTSAWKPTRKIPGGTHEYIDLIVTGSGRKQTRLLIELEFRAEFEMAKACEEYQNLINQIPKSYMGKPEHLNAIVRVLCDAAKRSMKEKKIHMGPWRKRSFMQMKWSASYHRSSSAQSWEHSPRQMQMPIPRFCLPFFAVEVT
ncbi:hypothetical protein HHK36_004471 [Tetracentron sinense]|uniref:Uncharacterized protein n=1 Tax=Tetracentron sinense TaxID=13715 RepID=A0A835DPI0_TETSI|nr:hypothetical protein HHK36_004471 [Tetracentron sinense]